MKTLIIATAAACIVAATASAQTAVPANQRFCLEVRDATGPHPLLCRFTTMDQCIASKTGQSRLLHAESGARLSTATLNARPYEANAAERVPLRGFFCLLDQLMG